MPYTIMLDSGHGGRDPGAVYNGRQEKDDALRLVLAIGEILQDRGIDVLYTRTEDIYESPFEKAMEANTADADFFISIHRNSYPTDNTVSGVESLIYDKSGIKFEMAENINEQLEAVGFVNLGVKERPNLVVLKRTRMPAVLVEVGFINSDTDNRLFDENFQDIAEAIAAGIIDTLGIDPVETSAEVFTEVSVPTPVEVSAKVSAEIPVSVPVEVSDEIFDGIRVDNSVSGTPVNSVPSGNPSESGNSAFSRNTGSEVRTYDTTDHSETEPHTTPETTRNSMSSQTDVSNSIPSDSETSGSDKSNPDFFKSDSPDSDRSNSRTVTSEPPASPSPRRPFKEPEKDTSLYHYHVQVGAFRTELYANRLLEELMEQNFPAFLVHTGNIYRVYVGAFSSLGDAVKMERLLKRVGYPTVIIA